MDRYARTSIDQVRYKDGTVLTLDMTMGGIAGGGEKPVSYTHLNKGTDPYLSGISKQRTSVI